MPTRKIELTDELDALVDALVQSGQYENASDVLRDGLRHLQQRIVEDAIRLEALREAAAIGIAALEAGDSAEFETREALTAYVHQTADQLASALEDR